MAVTNSLNINNSGIQDFNATTGQFTATELTTKGDLFGYTGSAYQRFPVGNDGYVLKADDSQAVGWRWACPSFEFIQSQSASSSATIDFTSFEDSDCYSGYKLVWESVRFSSVANTLNLRFSVDNGSNWLSSNYKFIRIGVNVVTGRTFRSESSFSEIILNSTPGSAASFYSGELFFHSSSDATNYLKQGITALSTSQIDVANYYTPGRFFGLNSTTSTVNGFRFFLSTGNITSGEFYLYGMLK